MEWSLHKFNCTVLNTLASLYMILLSLSTRVKLKILECKLTTISPESLLLHGQGNLDMVSSLSEHWVKLGDKVCLGAETIVTSDFHCFIILDSNYIFLVKNAGINDMFGRTV